MRAALTAATILALAALLVCRGRRFGEFPADGVHAPRQIHDNRSKR